MFILGKCLRRPLTFVFNFICVFIFDCAGSFVVAHRALHCCWQASSSCSEQGWLAFSSCSAQASHCSGLSCCRVQSLNCGLSTGGTWAQLPRGMWDINSWTRDWTLVSCIGRQILHHWATRSTSIFFYLSSCPSSRAPLLPSSTLMSAYGSFRWNSPCLLPF